MSSKRVRVALLLSSALRGCCVWIWPEVSAQTTSSPTSAVGPADSGPVDAGNNVLRRAARRRRPSSVPPTSVDVGRRTLSPATPPTNAQLPASTLELVFSQRAGQPLVQFGYDMFGIGAPVTATQIGNVQDNYVLGAGDQLSVVNRGHDNNSYTVPVDRDGRVIVPGYDPVQAGGRTFEEVRHDLQRVIAKDALQTQSYISLAQTRQINVLVTGEVNAPGVRLVSGLNTPIDALLLSGGIRKTGSLRSIVLLRGSRRIPIDLYSVIAHGNLASVSGLTDGDRIIVPPIGQTVAIIGLVNRPGIFELPAGARAVSGRSLVELAGGSFAGANHLSRIAIEPSGRMQLLSLGSGSMVRGGEVLSVDQQSGSSLGRVTLAGAVQLPGTRPLSETPTLSKLLRDQSDMTSNSYTPFALLVHRDHATGIKHASAFSVAKVLAHENDVKLGDDDIVFVFTTDQARALANAAAAQIQAAAQAGSVPPSVVTQALSASNATSSQSTSGTSTSPGGATTTSTNNAATIYASSNGGSSSASSAPSVSATPAPAGGRPEAADSRNSAGRRSEPDAGAGRREHAPGPTRRERRRPRRPPRRSPCSASCPPRRARLTMRAPPRPQATSRPRPSPFCRRKARRVRRSASRFRAAD